MSKVFIAWLVLASAAIVFNLALGVAYVADGRWGYGIWHLALATGINIQVARSGSWAS